MAGQTVENDIINAVKNFDPKSTIKNDALFFRLIASTQQIQVNEIFEAGISGELHKIVMDTRTAMETISFRKNGYIFITNNYLRFFSAPYMGKPKIDTSYCWGFHEISYSGFEKKFLIGTRIRFLTPLGDLAFSPMQKETHLEDFGNILKDKTTLKSIISTSTSDFVGELERLAKLKAQGILSNEEFEIAKSKLLK